MLNRRAFLKRGLAASAALIPLPFIKQDHIDKLLAHFESLGARKSIKGFNPDLEYGNLIPLTTYDMKSEEVLRVVKILLADAKKALPRGSVFELRCRVDSDYGRHKGVAWYTNKQIIRNRTMKPLFLTTPTKTRKDIKSGVAVFGRMRI